MSSLRFRRGMSGWQTDGARGTAGRIEDDDVEGAAGRPGGDVGLDDLDLQVQAVRFARRERAAREADASTAVTCGRRPRRAVRSCRRAPRRRSASAAAGDIAGETVLHRRPRAASCARRARLAQSRAGPRAWPVRSDPHAIRSAGGSPSRTIRPGLRIGEAMPDFSVRSARCFHQAWLSAMRRAVSGPSGVLPALPTRHQSGT